jgi:hypothetical protein
MGGAESDYTVALDFPACFKVSVNAVPCSRRIVKSGMEHLQKKFLGLLWVRAFLSGS